MLHNLLLTYKEGEGAREKEGGGGGETYQSTIRSPTSLVVMLSSLTLCHDALMSDDFQPWSMDTYMWHKYDIIQINKLFEKKKHDTRMPRDLSMFVHVSIYNTYKNS